MMKYKLLGRSGLRVSEFCLGTMTFGTAWGWGCDEAGCRSQLDLFFGQGGNFIDTSNVYGSGQAEEILGNILTPAQRNSTVLGTKYTDNLPGETAHANSAGNQRKNMVQSLEGSLKRLKTDYVDIFYVHTWDFTTRPEEVLRGLDDLIRQGKILYAGISDAPAWVISRCNELADRMGWSPFVVNQFEYSLVERTPDREIVPMSRALDIGMVAWSPLGGGILTGKYTANKDAGGSRRMDNVPYKTLSERNLTIARALDAVAQEAGCTPSQAALKWMLKKRIIPVIGASSADQLKINLASLDVELSDDQLGQLESASAVELGFPHDFFESAKGFVYAGLFDRIDRHRDDGIGTSADAKQNANFSYTDVMIDSPAQA
ncbi:aldo/keto reductase [Sphingobium cupriresistens]|nr:aldo/keto reductase [Sphingobium cupriresistens]